MIVNSDNNSPISNRQNPNVDQLWNEIGFHKPLAGFWFRLVLMLFSLIASIVIAGAFLGFFYPWPESASYRTIAGSIFLVYFQMWDLGTHQCMDRYIAESRIKDPNKMLLYIQYFINYQMLTGLLQTTTVSIYALWYVPRTDLAYAVWLMLVISTTQYPGFLGVFGGVLNSLQYYNKSEILNFVSGEIFQRITEIVFLLIGRAYGAAHPEIGELMGIAIGSAIGLYVDDFFATILSAYFFSHVMKNEGIQVRDCFRHDFNWNLIKDPLFFGIKAGLPWLEYSFSNLVILWLWLTYVPQYATFSALAGMANSIAGFMNIGIGVMGTSIISEAYLNGKVELTQYYMGQMCRFGAFIQGFLLSILLIVAQILSDAFMALNLQNYMLAVPFIYPYLIRSLQQPYTSLADSIILGSNHPNFFLFICIVQDLFRMFFMPLWIVWLSLPARYGINAIIWLIPCGEYIPILIKTVWMWVFIHRKIFPIKIPLWQTIGVPYLSAGIVFSFEMLVKILIFDPISQEYNFFLAAGIAILVFIFSMLFLYVPLTGLLGGWDTSTLTDFEKAARMSGPSKFIVWPMYHALAFFCRKSPLHNRFGMDPTVPHQQMVELYAEKMRHTLKTD